MRDAAAVCVGAPFVMQHITKGAKNDDKSSRTVRSVALRIPKDILADLQLIAATSERTRSWVIVRALKAYLASEGRDILAVAKGRAEIAQGRSFALEDVLDELDGKRSDDAAA